ncbi:MAG: hypothetical protein ABSD85_18180 [Acidimicrobiales bacterium]
MWGICAPPKCIGESDDDTEPLSICRCDFLPGHDGCTHVLAVADGLRRDWGIRIVDPVGASTW